MTDVFETQIVKKGRKYDVVCSCGKRYKQNSLKQAESIKKIHAIYSHNK